MLAHFALMELCNLHKNHAHVPRLSDSGMNDLIVDTLISDFNNNIGTYKSTKIIPYPKRIDGSVSALENQKSTKPKITLLSLRKNTASQRKIKTYTIPNEFNLPGFFFIYSQINKIYFL